MAVVDSSRWMRCPETKAMKVWTRDELCSLMNLIGGNWRLGLLRDMSLAAGEIEELRFDGQCTTTSSFQHVW